MQRLRKEDNVVLLAGKDKGRQGRITEFVGADRAIVEGLNLVKKHVKATQPGSPEGIINAEAPIHLSNLAIVNEDTDTSDKIGFRLVDGEKRRIYRSTGEFVDL